MHCLGSHYVRYLNSRLDRDGPLFRGRFHAVTLATLGHVDHVGRYIHRNPLDIRPAVELDRYEWSSLRYYAHDQGHPRWLRMDTLLAEHGSRSEYRAYIDGDAPRRKSPWAWAVATAVDELVDDASLRINIGRTVSIALLDSVDVRKRPDIEQWLAFPSAGARAQALKRMRQRRTNDPLVARIATRAIELAA